jgi:hypothetical protein
LPADCQERISKLKTRIDSLIAEEASLEQRMVVEPSDPPSALEVAEWATDLGALLRAGSAQQRKALFRLLIKELRVMSRQEILPTYRVPALVRAPDGQVDLAGRCVNRLPLLGDLRQEALHPSSWRKGYNLSPARPMLRIGGGMPPMR